MSELSEKTWVVRACRLLDRAGLLLNEQHPSDEPAAPSSPEQIEEHPAVSAIAIWLAECDELVFQSNVTDTFEARLLAASAQLKEKARTIRLRALARRKKKD